MPGQVTRRRGEVSGETGQTPATLAANRAQLHVDHDDHCSDDEGGQVENEPGLGAEQRDHAPTQGQAERLVDLLEHGSQAHRTGEEASILDQIGVEHEVGGGGGPADGFQREQQHEQGPQRSLRNHQGHQSHDAGAPQQVRPQQDPLVRKPIDERAHQAAAEEGGQQADGQGGGGGQW